ncbi:MAG: beta-ketoacyl-[acyl-carrier-protein] synthase family protein [Paludibacteraceae bacterium]|nr:beta-ketoacyl-[acyl-carrier-protein] synthase family protein [Paludibacteraceae bacterium]
MHRVVITGIGAYSSIGKNVEEVADSLYHGRSGVGLDPERKAMGYRSSLTGLLTLPDVRDFIDRRRRHTLSEQGFYACVAAREAFAMAGIDDDYLDQNEVGVLIGSDSSAAPIINGIDDIREKGTTLLVGSGSVFQSMTSTVSMNLSVIFKLRGISFSIAGACASGSHAIGVAVTLIQSGLQDCILCGGAQEVNKYSVATFDGISTFSVRENEPQKASRPFDRDRDGLVPSGGAATLVLESYESAMKRGAKILAEVVGYGFSSNAEHISIPNVYGPKRAMDMAIRKAGLAISEIDYINAHATSTIVGDDNEAKAITEIWGDKTPLVSSTKSMTGHELWMSGASEVVYSILMMQNDFVAPNLNFENPDEISAKLNIPALTIDKKIDVFLSNSFGFGGTNSSLVIRRFR